MLLNSEMLSKVIESEKRFEASVSSKNRAIIEEKQNTTTINVTHLLNSLAYQNISFGEFVNNKERILDENDLIPINYFEKGLVVAAAVARINIIDVEGKTGFGTGFLIGSNILMTNNHVIGEKESAINSFAEFEYELDKNNKPKNSFIFAFDPDKLFITDKDLDFTIIYVKQVSISGGKNISDYGFIPVIETVGKAKEGDAVSIIQHPKGERKSIALRNNKIVQIQENFLHYQTDTEPGSSGSPVFNDKWELVGLHHSGVPERDAMGRILTKQGTLATANNDESEIAWIANEGVRISRIVAFLRQKASAQEKLFLKDIIGSLTNNPINLGNNTSTGSNNNADASNYYRGINFESSDLFTALSDLITTTHKNELKYAPSKHLYPHVDVYSDGTLRSIYSGKSFTAQELMLLDEQVDMQRKEKFLALATQEVSLSINEMKDVLEDIESSFPYNCEHVVPQSWFGKKEPMRGDLHHLFACESRCNSFRSNTPYFDFVDYQPTQTPTNEEEVIRGDCGKSERNNSIGFEPEYNQGVVARATLYFLLRYPKNISNRYDLARLQTLISWHKKFGVSDYERSRNQKIHEAQGNRNPLIDYPGTVDKIDFTKGL